MYMLYGIVGLIGWGLTATFIYGEWKPEIFLACGMGFTIGLLAWLCQEIQETRR